MCKTQTMNLKRIYAVAILPPICIAFPSSNRTREFGLKLLTKYFIQILRRNCIIAPSNQRSPRPNFHQSESRRETERERCHGIETKESVVAAKVLSLPVESCLCVCKQIRKQKQNRNKQNRDKQKRKQGGIEARRLRQWKMWSLRKCVPFSPC